MNKTTPMMKQYLSIKEQSLLFFRMGDFYDHIPKWQGGVQIPPQTRGINKNKLLIS